jgi:hypothetical protein
VCDVSTFDMDAPLLLSAACLKGSIAGVDKVTCTPCELGFYAPEGATKCTACPDGFTTKQLSSYNASQCSGGFSSLSSPPCPLRLCPIGLRPPAEYELFAYVGRLVTISQAAHALLLPLTSAKQLDVSQRGCIVASINSLHGVWLHFAGPGTQPILYMSASVCIASSFHSHQMSHLDPLMIGSVQPTL